MLLGKEEKKILIETARKSIKSRLSKEHPDYSFDEEKFPMLLEKAGAFVTLTENKRLRGCIGYIEPIMPLIETVQEAASHAAFNDPRFHPLQKDEFEKIEIEISVLYPPYDIKSYDEIILGKHGIILDELYNKALLLPQVATEYNMDLPEFLSSLCEKAGINRNEWKRRNLKMKVFECQVFEESELNDE